MPSKRNRMEMCYTRIYLYQTAYVWIWIYKPRDKLKRMTFDSRWRCSEYHFWFFKWNFDHFWVFEKKNLETFKFFDWGNGGLRSNCIKKISRAEFNKKSFIFDFLNKIWTIFNFRNFFSEIFKFFVWGNSGLRSKWISNWIL